MSDFDSQHESAYLQTLQQLITRMHAASAVSKQVCVGLVAAIIAFTSANNTPPTALIALIPISVLWFLDSFYLSVERDVVDKYKSFVNLLHHGNVRGQLHRVDLDRRWWWRPVQTARGGISFSVWPFYVALVTFTVAVVIFGDIVTCPRD